jgi:hypothetical protein
MQCAGTRQDPHDCSVRRARFGGRVAVAAERDEVVRLSGDVRHDVYVAGQTIDGTKHKAKIVGLDKKTDLAVLRTRATAGPSRESAPRGRARAHGRGARWWYCSGRDESVSSSGSRRRRLERTRVARILFTDGRATGDDPMNTPLDAIARANPGSVESLYDHRLVDGEQAVTFLVRVKERQDPVRMLREA